MELVLNILMVDLLKKNIKHFKAESIAVLLFIMMNIPNSIHTSKVTAKSENEVSLAIGKIAIVAV